MNKVMEVLENTANQPDLTCSAAETLASSAQGVFQQAMYEAVQQT